MTPSALEPFHPAVRTWFERRFPLGPTEPQAAAWPRIRSGEDVLVASPTGTGKTLTGFLVAIDAAIRRGTPGELVAGAGAGGARGGGKAGGADGAAPAVVRGPQVVYISPLRALAVDVHENLQLPLEGVRAVAAELGMALPDLSVAVRTGDTPQSERATMRRKPPDLLVTTPESLYLLLTASGSRQMLGGVRTVIVDEVHTLARDKRGAHLALSLERLHRVVAASGTGHRLQRIGLSATQRPLETIARLLSGTGDRETPAIIDCGHQRDLDVAIELPSAELEAVASHQQFDDVLDRIAGHVRDHRTTLVFVNTRKMAERVAHRLAERLDPATAPEPAPDYLLHSGAPGAPGALGPVVVRDAVEGDGDGTAAAAAAAAERFSPGVVAERPGPGRRDASGIPDAGALAVAAHHGSLSAARRRSVESRLRAGQLRALVATASLELGIDVGPVGLVCQLGSPRAIGTFLQRVGRANHQVEGTPAGRLYPLTRDELVECTALLGAVRAGRLDVLVPPKAPLDVLAQQIVAEVAAAGEVGTEELFAMVRAAAPYADLERAEFDKVVDLVSWGVVTGRGRRGAFLHHDAVNGRLRARRGARMTALTAGGAIPETGDYRVVLDPEGVTVGSVHEDFAVEANIGDVFLLGTHSWRVGQVEVGTVRVTDAGDAPPTVPFWLGEAPARTAELSEEVGRLREMVDEALAGGGRDDARRALTRTTGVSAEVADQVVAYLSAGRAALGTLPTHRRLVVERFFDESEGMQLIVHSPTGGRVNRAFGLALRKRFCVTFDFELQAAADDDTVALSLGPQHSFPLADVPKMLSSRTSTGVLTQAVLLHPMLQARWRWNCNRALVVPRARGGQRRPIHLQRMEADDLLAATWPALAACQENTAPGPIPVPDHVLVRQTVADCLSEALDAEGLAELLGDLESQRIDVAFVESAEPSVLAHGILTGRPYTFLDGAPLEERRTRAVPLRRGLGEGDLPVPAGELAPFDDAAVATVLEQVRPQPRNADELHDLLLSLVWCRPVPEWQRWFEQLSAEGRVHVLDGCWTATERRDEASRIQDDDDVAAACIGGHLDVAGPVSVAALVSELPLPAGAPKGAPLSEARARTALARLEAAGSAFALPDGRWCARHLLVRLYRASRSNRRQSVRPASIAAYLRALTRWQHAAPGDRLEGRAGLLAVVEQLQGIEAPAGDWESEILPARVRDYDPRWLDELCLAGEIAWGRLTPRTDGSRRPGAGEPAPSSESGAPARAADAVHPGAEPAGGLGPPLTEKAPGVSVQRGSAVPSPATPLALVVREDLPWQLAAVRCGEPPTVPIAGPAADLLAVLERRGACFRSELAEAARRLPVEVDDGLWDLVARGLVTADAFSAVRSLLSARQRWRARQRHRPSRRFGLAPRRAPVGSGVGEGRWSILRDPGLHEPDGHEPDGHERDGHEHPGSEAVAAEELAEAVAGQLLVRWGIVAWELWAREPYRLPWRDVVRALRRLEARGLCLGGRFVAGLSGEQYALADAVEMLRAAEKPPVHGSGDGDAGGGDGGDDVELSVAGSDPLNLTGLVVPGPRVPASRNRRVRYRDGALSDERPAG